MLVNIVKKDEVGSNDNKNIKESRSKLVKILAKSKNRYLFKSRFWNLSKFKNFVKV